MTRDQVKKNNARFNGKRISILERDGYKCVDCNMTQEEHLKKWNKSLTINHIDGNGRNSDFPNNDENNLETLCLRCHGLKDGPRWMISEQDAHPPVLEPAF
jgi:hypothetical protein